MSKHNIYQLTWFEVSPAFSKNEFTHLLVCHPTEPHTPARPSFVPENLRRPDIPIKREVPLQILLCIRFGDVSYVQVCRVNLLLGSHLIICITNDKVRLALPIINLLYKLICICIINMLYSLQ